MGAQRRGGVSTCVSTVVTPTRPPSAVDLPPPGGGEEKQAPNGAVILQHIATNSIRRAENARTQGAVWLSNNNNLRLERWPQGDWPVVRWEHRGGP